MRIAEWKGWASNPKPSIPQSEIRIPHLGLRVVNIDLTGKVALVTGGSRGIGKDIAAGLVRAGAKVAILGRDEARAVATAGELGPNAKGYRCDVAVPADVEQALEAVEKDLGPIDVLVNNAGTTRDNLLFRIGLDDWDQVLATNLKGAFLVTKLVARGMIKRRWGRVINIASVVGLIGNKGQANYAASKAGLIGLTKAVARELASRNVLVNAVAPGYIDTELTRAISDEAKQTLQAAIPLARLGSGGDVAGAVLFLASDLASYITGQVIVVDGGMVM
jgi:3-oxoacyl-[acyl-carrier protein] reductase